MTINVTKAINHTTHARMYQRVVIRLLMACLPAPPKSPSNWGTRRRTPVPEAGEVRWQGRKDSNPRPSVLEFRASILPASARVGGEFNPSSEVGGIRWAWLYLMAVLSRPRS